MRAVVADDEAGLQLGLINIARTVHGAQLGLINVARQGSSTSIGLLSFIRDGTHTEEAYGGDIMPFDIGTKLGGRRGYGILALGIDPFRPTTRWSYGGGLGVHFPVRGLAFDVDLIVHGVQPDIQHFDTDHIRVVSELRVLLTWQPIRHLGLFSGPTVHVSVSDDPCCQDGFSVLPFAEHLWQLDRFAVRLGPGFSLGLRTF